MQFINLYFELGLNYPSYNLIYALDLVIGKKDEIKK